MFEGYEDVVVNFDGVVDVFEVGCYCCLFIVVEVGVFGVWC